MIHPFRFSSGPTMFSLLRRVRRWRRERRVRRITLDHATTRVRRGAASLDDVDPGWHRRLDPATLELADGRACVLGQLHGDYRWGLARAHLLNLGSAPQASLSPVAYGFQCEGRVPADVQARDYALLTQAWRAAIRQRRAADPVAPAAPAPATPAPARGVRRVRHGTLVAQPAEARA
jgi:hypothetical protein